MNTTASAPKPGAQEPYRDRKRYAWIFSLLVPCTVALGPSLVLATGDFRMLDRKSVV